MSRAFRFQATILRKQEDLPRYVIVEPELVAGRDGSFDAKVTLNGHAAFDRRIHPWGKGSDAYFFNLTQVQCQKAGVETGDVVEVQLAVV